MYKITFCDPFAPAWMELENFPPDLVIEKFEEIRWNDHLFHSRSCKLREYFSPSFSIEDPALGCGIECWAVDNDHGHEWLIFYKRPEVVRSWLGLRRRHHPQYVSNISGQNREQVISCLRAFVHNDFNFLRNKIR